MLLPYWTGGCVGSMEGLLFESSATTPYHFIDQAELSTAPSDPDATIQKFYGPLDVALGVQHLQLLGVRYFMAESAQVEAQANADPSLKLIASTGPWTNGALKTTWEVYQVKDAPLVSPLSNLPAVLKGIKSSPSSWLTPSLNWYADPRNWNVELAQSGPSSWPRQAVGAARPQDRDRSPDHRHPHPPHRFVGELRRLARRDARAGEDLLLPQLARHRSRMGPTG